MAIDKNKIEQGAIKLAQKGQLGKAVAEYQKILMADPKDLRTRIKLLNLYGQMGRKDDAIEECRRISEAYTEQGFVPRAIAVWSQAIRLDPGNPEPYASQGDLYLKQQLVGNAIDSFRKAVELYRSRGKDREAGELLTRMEVMAPGNVAIKLHLAELYLDGSRFDEFRAEIEKIILQLKGEGRARKLLTLLEGFYQKSGKRVELVKPLSDLYVELGEDEKALEIMRDGLSDAPGDRDLRLNSIRANLALGNLLDARKIALSIHEENPEDLFILEQLAAIAQARGDRDELIQWYKETALVYRRKGVPQQEELFFQKVLELCPDDAEALLALGGMHVIIKEQPGKPAEGQPEDGFFLDISSEILGIAPAAQVSDTEKAIADGLIEAELYVKYGLDEKAYRKLSALVDLAPDHLELRQKLRDVSWRRGDRTTWALEQHRIARLLLEKGRKDEALRVYDAILDVSTDDEAAKRAVADLRGVEPEAQAYGGELPTEGGVRAQALLDADQLARTGQDGEAISLLIRLSETYPNDPDIAERLQRLGWVEDEEQLGSLGQEDFSDVRDELGTLEFDVASSIAGFEAVEVNELDDIVKEFRSGVAEKLDDSDYETHYDLGVAYKEMGLLDDALEEFRKAARFTEKAKNAYTSIAMIYRETAQYDDARSALRLALAVPLNSPEDRAAILYELGMLAEETGDWEGAASAYEKAVELHPGFLDLAQRFQDAKVRAGR